MHPDLPPTRTEAHGDTSGRAAFAGGTHEVVDAGDHLVLIFESGHGPSARVQVPYRGRVTNAGAVWMDGTIHIVLLWQIPWSELRDQAVRSRLQRHVRERGEDAFGIHVGDTATGKVQTLATTH